MATVDSLIAGAQAYALDIVADADLALRNATNFVVANGYKTVTPKPVTFTQPLPPETTEKTVPVYPPIEFVEPSHEPQFDPVFQDLDDLDLSGEPRSFDEPRPEYEEPTKPNQLPDFTDELIPLDLTWAFPEVPSELQSPSNIQPAPVIADRSVESGGIKPIGAIVTPTFDGVLPVDGTTVPTDHQTRFEGAFRGRTSQMTLVIDSMVDAMLTKYNPQYHSQMAAIETQLSTYLAGGTGLNSDVENAIYERARGKNNAEALRVRNSAYDDAAGRGFTIPPGALLAIVQGARQAGADNNARAASEIVVMQAEMEQKNLQFAVTTSTGLRTAMVQATLSYMQNLVSINGQALEYAKAVLSAIIEIYNTEVRMYGQQLEAYKAEAAAYDVKVRAAMIQVERYKAEIQGLDVTIQADRNRIDIYKARIETLMSYANTYKAQIEAVQGRIGLEKLKLEIFQTQVQSYTTQVQGKDAEWRGYTAQVGGQTAKFSAFTAAAGAYSEEYKGYQLKLAAQNEQAQLRVVQNKHKFENYAAQVSLHKAVIDARGEIAKTKMAMQRQDLTAFQAEISLAVSNANLQQNWWKLKTEVDIQNEDRRLKAEVDNANNLARWEGVVANLAATNAKTYGQLASATMAGMNTLVGKQDISNL